MDQAQVTLIVGILSAIVGSFGGQAVGAYTVRKTKAAEIEVAKNNAERAEQAELRDEIDAIEEDLDGFKEKYYALREENIELHAKVAHYEFVLHQNNIQP